MPYKSEKIIIQGTNFDRRRRLTDSDKIEVKKMYASGNYSYNKIARFYGVSKRLIIFIVNPEKHIKNLEDRRAKGGSKIYYDKDKNTIAIRESRRYKQKLYKEGKI